MSNSKLVVYKKISPNKNHPRNHKIDTITIHCMAGPLSIESCGNLFAKSSTQASSNYGIGPDGRIALYVDEGDRSWATSSASNDNRAITIEVASSSKHPYEVTDAAYKALIELIADICKRNNIKKLLWKGDKNLIGQVDKQNMTVHRWFKNKACPGDYLYNKHPDIVKKVNKKLTVDTKKTDDKKKEDTTKKTDEKKTNTDTKTKNANFRVKIKVNSLNIRKTASASGKIVGSVKKDQIYTITKVSGDWGYLKSGAGWINCAVKYVTKIK